jgi:hypothetical protein
MSHIGFTGTRHGTNKSQRTTLARLLNELHATDLHHGDCIGADNHAHYIARDADCRIHLHPPTDPKKRAFCALRSGMDTTYPTKPYLDRNRDIVDASEIVIATPSEVIEPRRSGTWATIRYAIKCRKRTIIVYPDGMTNEEAA